MRPAKPQIRLRVYGMGHAWVTEDAHIYHSLFRNFILPILPMPIWGHNFYYLVKRYICTEEILVNGDLHIAFYFLQWIVEACLILPTVLLPLWVEQRLKVWQRTDVMRDMFSAIQLAEPVSVPVYGAGRNQGVNLNQSVQKRVRNLRR